MKEIRLVYADEHANTIERHLMNILQEDYPIARIMIGVSQLTSRHSRTCSDCESTNLDLDLVTSYFGRHRVEAAENEAIRFPFAQTNSQY